MNKSFKSKVANLIFVDLSNSTDVWTEEGLRMIISRKVASRALEKSQVVDNTDEQVVKNGAWVYENEEDGKWIFERYNTIEQAVRRAVNLINAKVICDGEIIKYDTFDANEAYYVDRYTNEVVFMKINGQSPARVLQDENSSQAV